VNTRGTQAYNSPSRSSPVKLSIVGSGDFHWKGEFLTFLTGIPGALVVSQHTVLWASPFLRYFGLTHRLESRFPWQRRLVRRADKSIIHVLLAAGASDDRGWSLRL